MTGVVFGGCNNDRRYPDRYVIRSHVKDLQFHRVPSDLVVFPPAQKKGMVKFPKKGTLSARDMLRGHFQARGDVIGHFK